MRIYLRNGIILTWGGAMVTLGAGLQQNNNDLLTASAIFAISTLVQLAISLVYFYINVWRKK